MDTLRKTTRWLALTLLTLAYALQAHAVNFTDIWWNASESGWGLTLAHHNDKMFGVWYVYDTDGKPLWVVMPSGQFSNGGRTYTGELYKTSGPSYRAARFDPNAVKRTVVGSANFEFDSDDVNATVTYTISGTTTVKRVTRQPYGNAPANFGGDHSDLWWDPAESGWGLSLNHHGDNIFGVWYTYDEGGRPLWVVWPGGTFSADGKTFTGKLYTTTGSPYITAFQTGDTKLSEVGTGTLTFFADEARFTSTVRGHTQTKRLLRQSFGTPIAANKAPTVSIAVTSAVEPPVAPAAFTLTATAADSDGRITKVSFFKGYDKIGEASSAPYQITVSDLAAGKYYFSALAFDDRGKSSLSTSAAKEVKGSGGGGGTVTNKAPTVALSAPANNAQYLQGANIDLTATAADSDGTVAKVEFFANAAKVGEALAAPFQATWMGALAGPYALTAVATDDKGAATTSTSRTVVVVGPAAVVDAQTKDAARFLTQATFGIKSVAEINALKAQGYEAWLSQQFAMTWPSHVKYVDDRKAAGEKADEERAYEAIWQQWLWSPGQLRARMSFALSEIFVVSNIAPDLETYAMASYMDLLNRNAFGNYRTLLEEVTLHPTMGYYLNMIGSRKEDPVKGTHPNENYAREVMQLFSIGLYKLNQDGTRQVDSTGKFINTYDESVIKAMAAAFTGWNFAGNDTTNPAIFNPPKENWVDPMQPWESMHDTKAKAIFDAITLPAGQTARQDLKGALDALSNHPNVGPFIGRQLIQRFVTSNPSPAYIGRVAAVFNNNGQGVRGDLRATLRAVLLDPDARDLAKTAEAGWGKQREPVIRFANYLRGLNATSTSGRNRIWYLDSADEGLNQSPLLAPSVFNFFSPNYRQPGPLSAAGLVAPEFQITTETSMVGGLNFFGGLVTRGYYGNGDTRLTMNLTELNAMANTPAQLADRLSLLFMNGSMSDGLRATIISTLGAMSTTKTGSGGTTVTDRVKAALILVALSPDFVIQK